MWQVRLSERRKAGMITELTDMPGQPNRCRRRTGHFVGDNVYVSTSPVAKAVFVCAPAKPLRSNRMSRKLASSRENRLFGNSFKRQHHAQTTDATRVHRKLQVRRETAAGLQYPPLPALTWFQAGSRGGRCNIRERRKPRRSGVPRRLGGKKRPPAVQTQSTVVEAGREDCPQRELASRNRQAKPPAPPRCPSVDAVPAKAYNFLVIKDAEVTLWQAITKTNPHRGI